MKSCLLILLVLLVMTIPVLARQEAPAFVVTTAELNIRSLPSTSGARLQTAPVNTTLQVIGRNGDGSWLQVAYKGVVGWVSSVYVATNGDISLLPVTDGSDPNVPANVGQSSAPDGTIVANGTLVIFSSSTSVNVRQQPDFNSVLLGTVDPGVRVVVTQVDSSRSWGRIDFNGQVGWVELYAVTVLGDIRTVAVAGQPGSGTNLPVPGGPPSLEQRAVVDRAQAHLAKYLPAVNELVFVLSLGADADPFVACGPEIPFMKSYVPARRDYELVPDLLELVRDMNAAIRQLNRARAAWILGCGPDKTLVDATRFSPWLATAQEGLADLQDVQTRLAELSAE